MLLKSVVQDMPIKYLQCLKHLPLDPAAPGLNPVISNVFLRDILMVPRLFNNIAA